jgi:hypothetical protein
VRTMAWEDGKGGVSRRGDVKRAPCRGMEERGGVKENYGQ